MAQDPPERARSTDDHVRRSARTTHAPFPRLWAAQVGAPVALASRLAPLAVARLRYVAGLALTYEFEKGRNATLGSARILPSQLVRQRS